MDSKNYSDSITPISLCFDLDNSIQIINHNITTVENCNFNLQPILQNCNDIKINNYTCLFNTHVQSLSDNITPSTIYHTALIYTSCKDDVGYLTCPELLTDVSEFIITHTNEITENSIFNITFIDELSCKIQFTNTITNNSYSVDVINLSATQSSEIIYFYTISANNITLYDNNSSTTLAILYNNTNIDYTNAFSRYDNVSGGILESKNNQKSNLLLNVSYTTVTGDTFSNNILTFKNQKTYTDHDCFHNYWYTDNFNDVQTLQTGTWQEHGNTHIYNVEEFYTADILIKPGYNTIVTPSTLYPYEQIDINDTTFGKTGAFGSNTPITSDRIYSARYTNQQDNNVLLCTWLSSNGVDSVWIDRYYNPTLFEQNTILATKSDGVIFDILDKYKILYNVGFFDKQSDLTLKPNQTLHYYHITPDDAKSYTSHLRVNEIDNITNTTFDNVDIYTSNEITLSGTTYGKFSQTSNDNDFAISLDVEMYDWYENQFYDIINTQSNNCGIRIYNDVPLTPILMTWKTYDNVDIQHTTVTLYDTQFKQIDEFNLNGVAKKVFRTSNCDKIIAQFDTYVEVYTVFGAPIHRFDSDEHALITNCYCDDEYVYIEYTKINRIDDTIEYTGYVEYKQYDIWSFNEHTLYTNTTSALTLMAVTTSLWYSKHDLNAYCYTPQYGVMYLPSLTGGDLMLNVKQQQINELSDNDAKFITVHSNTHVDDKNNIVYDTHNIVDFAVHDNMLYFVTSTHLFITTLERENVTKIALPADDYINVNVTTTNEIKNHHFVKRVFVLLSTYTDVNVYEYIDGEFIYITKIAINSNTNLFELTESKYKQSCKSNICFEVAFKGKNNKTTKFKTKCDNISPGKHTLLINMNSIDGKCQLYVDDVCNCELIFDEIGKYTQTYDILQNNIVLGNTLLYNGGDLASYLNSSDYLLHNVVIKNVKFYNSALTPDDIRINSLASMDIPDITLQLPCGQRNKITKIKSIYNQTPPGYKSPHFDLIIKNLRLSEKNQNILTNSIKTYLANNLPVTTKLENILYKNY